MLRRGASGGRRRRRGAADDAVDVEETREAEPVGPGPYDVDDAPDDEVRRVDVGALRIPVVPGTQIQFQVDEASGRPLTVVVADGTSAMEMSVFAAPKSGKLWTDVRSEILESLRNNRGGELGHGQYGPEIRMRLTAANTGTMVPGRMIGFDGPRWFLRVVFTGKSGASPDAAPLLDEILQALVVVRGDEAMPVRDPLPLRLPREMTDPADGVEPGSATSERTKVTMPVRGVRMNEVR